MARRFAKISEVCAETKEHLEAVRFGNGGSFAEIHVYTGTRVQQLKAVLTGVLETPAAVIVAGGARKDAGSQFGNSRRGTLAVIVVDAWQPGDSEDFYDIADVAEDVHDAFLPADDTPGEMLAIAGVEYEAQGLEPYALLDELDTWEVSLETFDYQQNR